MARSTRVALLAGCNYAGKSCELSGCINDVKAVKELLKSRFDFEEKSITLLTDEQGTPTESQPTSQNIKNKLTLMASQSKPGDLLFFYFSGHGTKGKFVFDPLTDDGEAIVPSDFSLITKFDFRRILNKVNEATFVFISDSCHSGGLIDKEKVQIRNLQFETDKPTAVEQAIQVTEGKAKMIDHKELQQILGINEVDTHLEKKFWDKFNVSLAEEQGNKFMKEIGEDMGILISACRSEEVSYDLKKGLGENTQAHGAFTSALLYVLQQDPKPLSNNEIVESVRKVLLQNNFDQHSCLYSADKNASATFLLQQRVATERESQVVPMPIAPNFPPSSGAKGLDTGILFDVMDAALVYYQISSHSTQAKIKTWFDGLDLDHDKKVKAKDVHNALVKKKWCDSMTLSKFVNDIVGWDTSVDLNQFLALYYASKSLVKFCRKCGNYLKNHYFVCINCFRTERDEFNICAECLKKGTTCDQFDHKQFLDNHALLRYFHFAELRSSKDYCQEQAALEDINNYLEQAETSFRDDAHLTEAFTEMSKPKGDNFEMSLKTDACTIL